MADSPDFQHLARLLMGPSRGEDPVWTQRVTDTIAEHLRQIASASSRTDGTLDTMIKSLEDWLELSKREDVTDDQIERWLEALTKKE